MVVLAKAVQVVRFLLFEDSTFFYLFSSRINIQIWSRFRCYLFVVTKALLIAWGVGTVVLIWGALVVDVILDLVLVYSLQFEVVLGGFECEASDTG